MGIRIHKCLGYGLTDVKTKKNGALIDERFNELGYLHADCQDREATWTKEGWITYFKNHADEDHVWHTSFYKEGRYKDWEFDDQVVHRTEYGLRNVLLFIPPLYRDWQRCDNIIDYVEEAAKPKGQVNRYEVYDLGIWPNTGVYTDLRTNTRAGRTAHEFWSSVRSAKQARGKKRKAEMLSYAHFKAEKMGFADIEDAKKNLVPEVPEEIKLMCRFLCIFNDEDTIYQLRPMLYIYWG